MMSASKNVQIGGGTITHMLRTGVYTLTKMLIALCNAITKFSPAIIAISGNDPAVITALSAAMTACEALRLAIEPYKNPDY